VRVDAFSIGQYPVTFAAYDRFCEATGREKPSDRGWGRGERPVINVSWEDAQAYSDWLSKETGERYRVVTKAEWEYACRAGTDARWCWGDDEAQLDEFAWYHKNSRGKTQPVGQKRPNAWHLHDMHGNVWERCQDWYQSDYYQQLAAASERSSSHARTSPSAREQDRTGFEQTPSDNPQGPASGSSRVIRGGSWLYVADICRSAYRDGDGPSYRRGDLGFRLSRTV
jgi:formylglycine-generating enzyme required for sulfatase activity